ERAFQRIVDEVIGCALAALDAADRGDLFPLLTLQPQVNGHLHPLRQVHVAGWLRCSGCVVVLARHQFIKPRRALSGVHNCTAAACCASRSCCACTWWNASASAPFIKSMNCGCTWMATKPGGSVIMRAGMNSGLPSISSLSMTRPGASTKVCDWMAT